jgi:CDP-glycerol glycerophosphotransferase (TagB/SpsB family)
MHDYLLACSRFKAGNYEIINGFDIEKKILIQPDVINPDIVFFTKPLDGDDPFSIVKFSKSLTCYVPYSTYGDNNPKDQYDKFFHNLLWRHYVATKMHIDIASKNSRNNGVNIRVVGYPTGDALINPSDASLCLSKEIWKRAGARKKIIWAPHHTIQESDTETNHSNFLRLADIMIYLAKKYSEVAYFVFKPHPNLRRQLSILKEWGHEKTQKYYEQWELLENGHLEDGDYLALFIGSDALIHDSVSFMAEYIYTLKPCCYIVKNQNQLDKFLNTFGRRLLDLHDLSYSTDDIEKFIVSIVSNASDKKYVHKCAFLSEVLLPANERSAVKNILSDIESVLSARQ